MQRRYMSPRSTVVESCRTCCGKHHYHGVFAHSYTDGSQTGRSGHFRYPTWFMPATIRQAKMDA